MHLMQYLNLIQIIRIFDNFWMKYKNIHKETQKYIKTHKKHTKKNKKRRKTQKNTSQIIQPFQ